VFTHIRAAIERKKAETAAALRAKDLAATYPSLTKINDGFRCISNMSTRCRKSSQDNEPREANWWTVEDVDDGSRRCVDLAITPCKRKQSLLSGRH
jgi:hypothetical protein